MNGEYKSPRIIGLEIDEFDLESGVDMISLVENEAIEDPFKYFKSQIQEIQKEEKFNDTISEEELLSLLLEMEMGDAFERYIADLPEDVQEKLLEHLQGVGEDEEDILKEGYTIKSVIDVKDIKEDFSIKSQADRPSMLDTGAIKIRYKYFGPKDSKNRDFCASMMKTPSKVYRLEDINKATIQGANSEFGVYDIFQYRGSYNCRHTWMQVTYERDLQTGKVNESQAIAANQRPVTPVTTNVGPNTNAVDADATTSKFSAEDMAEKKMIYGPLMVPNKLIYRYDDFNGEYWVYFSQDTISKIAYKYLINSYQHNTNIEHSQDMILDDIVLVESWIVGDPTMDKSKLLMGKEYPTGTWFGGFKALSDKTWEEYIKTGKVLGFSVEGYFSDKLINMAKKSKFYYRTTQSGQEIVIDEKTFVVFILEDGKRSAIMSDGEYELTNGKKLVVIDSKAKEGSFESKQV